MINKWWMIIIYFMLYSGITLYIHLFVYIFHYCEIYSCYNTEDDLIAYRSDKYIDGAWWLTSD